MYGLPVKREVATSGDPAVFFFYFTLKSDAVIILVS